MINTHKFESLECWKKAEDLAFTIYEITAKGKFSSDFSLKNQWRKSAISIISNIAEGKERETHAELIRFLFYAKGSAGELRSQIRIARRIGFISSEVSQRLINDVTSLSIMIYFLIKYIKSHK